MIVPYFKPVLSIQCDGGRDHRLICLYRIDIDDHKFIAHDGVLVIQPGRHALIS